MKTMSLASRRCQNRKNVKRGFTLTEVAVVLGIMGLILGAVWSAASAVYSNMHISSTTTELLTVSQGVKAMYASSTTADTNANMTKWGVTAQTGNGLTYIRAGIFPGTSTDTGNAATATRAFDPWNGNVVVQAADALVAGDSLAFVVVFDNVPVPACTALLAANAGSGYDNSMIFAGAGAPAGVPANAVLGGTAPPLGIAAAQAQCTAGAATGTTTAVGFSFRIKG